MFKLRNSYFFRRIIALLLTGLLVWAVSTYLLFTFISRPLLVENKSRELLPQAQWIAERSSTYLLQGDVLVENLVNISYNFFNVWTLIVFSDNSSLETPLPDGLQEEIRSSAYELNQNNLEGNLKDFYGTIRTNGSKSEYLYVLAPIPSKFLQYTSDRPLGSVIMIQAMEDFNLSVRGLNLALLISSLICGLLLIIPIALLTRKIVEPLINIRRMALSITKGNFSYSVAVDPSRNDEVSDLVHAINHMSESLDHSLSELSLERNQLEEIINGISEGIVAVDENGKIMQTNEIMWELFQRSREHYTPEDLLNVSGLTELFATCFEEEASISELINLEEEKRIIQASINPIYDHNGHMSAAVGLFRDVTKSQRLEQTRRDYIANVSHELRTPITAMRALIEPLRDGIVKTEVDKQRYYDIILHETLRLSRLINDMLELSRLQSGTAYIEQGPINIHNFLSGVAEHFSFLAAEKDITFKTENITEDLPLVWGNEDRIEQILTTYMDNALKFTPEKGQIILRVIVQPHMLQIELEDNGSGIAGEDIPYVFERFYKADKAHDEIGTGLGLSIAKTLAEQLKMSVSVRSTKGEGAVFSLGLRYVSDVMRKETHMKEVFDFAGNADEGEDSKDKKEESRE